MSIYIIKFSSIFNLTWNQSPWIHIAFLLLIVQRNKHGYVQYWRCFWNHTHSMCENIEWLGKKEVNRGINRTKKNLYLLLLFIACPTVQWTKWITSWVLIKQTDEFLNSFANRNKSIFWDLAQTLLNYSLHIE